MSEKGNNVASSFAYKFIERFFVKIMGLIIGIVLARLLGPETFGLLAIITVFTNLAQTFVQSGLGVALVQNKATQKDDYSTVFYISFAIATVLVFVLFITAPIIAVFYERTELIWPLRVFSVSLFIGALSSVQVAKLQREMKFRLMMRCNLIATIVSGVVGIAAAYFGVGIWALVIYHLSQITISSVAMMIADKWHPEFVFSVVRAKELFGFGWKMLVSAVLCSLYNDLRSLIIGKRYSTESLAYYNKGQQFPEVIATTMDVSVQSVMLPVMSSEQDSVEKIKELTKRTVELSMFLVVPLMLGLASVAQTLIPVLLTEKWNESIPMMIVFCLAFVSFPLQTTNLSVIKALGRSDIYMKTEIIRRITMLVILLISVFVFDSVLAIAIGYLISLWIDAFIVVVASKMLIGIGWHRQLCWSWKTLLSGFVMAAGVIACGLIPMPSIAKLALQIVIGVVLYATMSWVLKNPAFVSVLSMVKGLKKRQTNI